MRDSENCRVYLVQCRDSLNAVDRVQLDFVASFLNRPSQEQVGVNLPMSRDTETASWSGLIDAAQEISDHRLALLSSLHEALERGDERQALSLARQLVGMEDEKSNRAHQSVN